MSNWKDRFWDYIARNTSFADKCIEQQNMLDNATWKIDKLATENIKLKRENEELKEENETLGLYLDKFIGEKVDG